jgi:hypothetical protein
MRGSTTVKAKRKPRVSNQVKLDTKNPIPFEFGGQAFAFIQGKKYIPFLWPEDNFFKTLLEAKTLSSTHNICIETKKDFCCGKGLKDANGKEFSPELIAWLKALNVKNQTALTINRKAFGSFFTFGNAPIEIVRFKVGSKAVMYVYVHNVLEWRLGWYDKDGRVSSAVQSKLFLRGQGPLSADMLKDAKIIPLYNPNGREKDNWFTDDKGVQRTMFWLKNEFDGYEDYGMPSSVSSLIYQVLEYKGARYNLDNFDNNMVLGGLLALKGNLGPEEVNKIAKSIINTHSGDGKRGRVAVVASEEGIDGSDYHQYSTQSEGSYISFDERIMKKIIMANQWDELLAGITPSHSLGKGNTFLRTIYEIKKKTVIEPAQTYMLENFWQPLQKIAAEWLKIDIDKYDLGIIDVDPISILSDVDPTPAIKVNEIRAAVGLQEDDGPMGQKYLGELKPAQTSASGGGDAGGGGGDVQN